MNNNQNNRHTESEIKELFRQHAASYAPDSSLLATVQEVDTQTCTCTLIDEDQLQRYNVRLKCITGVNKAVVNYPRVGSYVLAVRIEQGDDWMVVDASDVEKIEIRTANSSLVITDSAIVINGGNNQGIINIVELTAKLNALVEAFNTHVHAVSGTNTLPIAPPIDPFQASDYEDKNVKH